MGNQENTVETSRATPYNLAAGVLFAVLAFWQLLWQFVPGAVTSKYRMPWLAVFAIMSITTILKKRNQLPIITISAIAILHFADFIRYILAVSGFGMAFNFFYYVLEILADICLLCIATANCTDLFLKQRGKINKLWLIPTILLIAGNILLVYRDLDFVTIGWSSTYDIDLLGAYTSYLRFALEDTMGTLITAIAFLFSALWFVFPNRKLKQDTVTKNEEFNGNNYAQSEAYCGLGKHVLLLLFTFGIWYLIWIYRITGYLNCVEDEEPRNPTTKLLLCLFVPFYPIYWVYKSSQRIDKLARAKGLSSDLSTLCLILAIFVGIIPPILMQDKINAIISAEDKYFQNEPKATKPTTPGLGAAEELKTYKELLDSGTITQEEFDAKKKQLLNL